MESNHEEALMAREEECRKALKTLGKALFMRLVVTVLLVVIPLRTGTEPLVLGIVVLVGFVNLTSAFVLLQEWKKQRKLLNEILDQYE